MAVSYAFDKAKLPRGYSFPLPRSVLDAALEQACLTKVHVVYYWLRQGGSIVMRADHRGEGRRGWFAAGLSTITIYAVPSSERQATEAALVADGLPRLVAWLKALEQAGNVRRGGDQHFAAWWEVGSMTVEAS